MELKGQIKNKRSTGVKLDAQNDDFQKSPTRMVKSKRSFESIAPEGQKWTVFLVKGEPSSKDRPLCISLLILPL